MKRTGIICILICVIVILICAGSAFAIGAPDIYAEQMDLGRYNADEEKVSIWDNGENRNQKIKLLPVDEIGNIVWPPVDGAAWYKVTVRDVDNDVVVYNEDHQDASCYWFNPGQLSVGTNYKLAVGAYASEDNYAWGDYFYFRMVESTYEESNWEEYDWSEEEDYLSEEWPVEEDYLSDDWSEEEDYLSEEFPVEEDYLSDDGQGDYEVTQLDGYFEWDNVQLQIGNVYRLSGAVLSSGSPLSRITYQIDGWYGDDQNNRYCSQEVWDTNYVNLEDLTDMYLDTNNAPLNAPGKYKLSLVAKCADETWAKLAEITLYVAADGQDNAYEGNEQYSEDRGASNESSEQHVTDRSLSEEGEQHGDDQERTPEDILNSTEIDGYFKPDSFEMKVGSKWSISGEVASIGSPLVRITYQIDGWDGDDGNNRYCSQEVANADYVNLEDLTELYLDGTRAPLNVPGKYNLHLVAKCADDTWAKLDEITVTVTGETAANTSDDGADSGESEKTDENVSTPATSTKIEGYFGLENLEMEVGSKWIIPGEVASIGSPLNRITYQIDGWDGDDRNNRYCSQGVANTNYVNLEDLHDLYLDGTRAPLNEPGKYTLHLVASCEDTSWKKLAKITVVVKGNKKLDIPADEYDKEEEQKTTIKSETDSPSVVVHSVTPASVNNSGNNVFNISVSAKNMKYVTFEFGDLLVDEKWDHDSENSPHRGYQNNWYFDGKGDIEGYRYEETNWVAKFYPKADSTEGTYNILITAYGENESSSTTTTVTLKQRGKGEPQINSDVKTTTDSQGNIVIDFSTKTKKVVNGTPTRPYYYLDNDCAYPDVDNLRDIINQFDVDGQGYKFQLEYRNSNDQNRGFYERTPDGSTYCTWYVRDVCRAVGAPWIDAGGASVVYNWAKINAENNGWIKLGNGSKTVLQQAVSKTNEGYLVVGVYDGHVFMLYPQGSETPYISQAGAQNNRCNTLSEVNNKAKQLGKKVKNKDGGEYYWGSIRNLDKNSIIYYYWPGN